METTHLPSKTKWWGYKNVNGWYNVKRYFNEEEISQAERTATIQEVSDPFEAKDRDEAMQIIKQLIE